MQIKGEGGSAKTKRYKKVKKESESILTLSAIIVLIIQNFSTLAF